MRVDSVGAVSAASVLPGQPRILKFGKFHIALDELALTDALNPKLVRRAEKHEREQPAIQIHGGTFLRRMAGRLPSALVLEIRRLLRQKSFSDGMATGPLVTKSDGKLVRMFFNAAFETYARKPLAAIFNRGARNDQSSAPENQVLVDGEYVSIISAVTKNAQPELMWTIDHYNLVKFDSMFYGVPHGAAVDWDSGVVASIPGMLVGASIRDVVTMIVSRAPQKNRKETVSGPAHQVATSESSRLPILLATMPAERYNIISYEGWIYGMPHELGPIDLAEVDVMEMPGVIRDVSRDAVEEEILARSREKSQAA